MENIKLVGSQFTKIIGNRNPSFDGKLNMNTNIQVDNIEKAKNSKDVLKISYTFKITYGDLGDVEVQGDLFIALDAKTMKTIEKDWKDKKFDTPEHIAITNLVIQRASIKALDLEEQLGLPPHMRFPMVSMKKE